MGRLIPYSKLVLACAVALTGACANAPLVQPPAPYFSIEFGQEATREAALERLKELGDIEGLRAEGRSTGWFIRAGSWTNLTDAGHGLRAHPGKAQRALEIENPVPWLLADGSMIAVSARPASASAPTNIEDHSARQPPSPYYSIEFGQEATREAALARMKELGDIKDLRTEKRISGWVIRAGAWQRIEDAERALLAQKDTARRLLQVEDPVPWLLVDGSTVRPSAD